MKSFKRLLVLSGLSLAVSALAAAPASATIVGFAAMPNSTLGAAPMIIAAPLQVQDSAVTNSGQQGFDEKQGVLLLAPLNVDGVVDVAAGTYVDSHMIFLNRSGSSSMSHLGVIWVFSGTILGVMSDNDGMLEANSTAILGAPSTIYPAAFNNRGFESNDSYSINGNQLTVNMNVSQPGDWIRVVTASPIPEPGTMLLLGTGLAGLALRRRRRA